MKLTFVSCRRCADRLKAGFFAGVVFYLTLFYTRGELGFRIALFFGSALLAGAFSGLISFGVFQIHHATIPGWKWLFIIEGDFVVHRRENTTDDSQAQ